jgi:hypothetical protein
LPSLRRGDVFSAIQAAFSSASKDRFRLLHHSVQTDHVHLVVEAESSSWLRRGLQGLAIRVAKAVNRIVGKRGPIWADRNLQRLLCTPREVRNALVYVLQNWRKHLPGGRGVDPRSSAGWFTGWRIGMPLPCGKSPVRKARTWLAAVGWRRHGLIGLDEVPRSRPPLAS